MRQHAAKEDEIREGGPCTPLYLARNVGILAKEDDDEKGRGSGTLRDQKASKWYTLLDPPAQESAKVKRD